MTDRMIPILPPDKAKRELKPDHVVVVHTTRMTVGARLFHYTMIVLTFGLWIPIYLMIKRQHGER